MVKTIINNDLKERICCQHFRELVIYIIIHALANRGNQFCC
jgi:hypothetical protein